MLFSENVHCLDEYINYFLQVENLLLNKSGALKLCDFGSATTKTYEPDHGWSAMKRSIVEDEVSTKLYTLDTQYYVPKVLFAGLWELLFQCKVKQFKNHFTT